MSTVQLLEVVAAPYIDTPSEIPFTHRLSSLGWTDAALKSGQATFESVVFNIVIAPGDAADPPPAGYHSPVHASTAALLESVPSRREERLGWLAPESKRDLDCMRQYS